MGRLISVGSHIYLFAILDLLKFFLFATSRINSSCLIRAALNSVLSAFVFSLPFAVLVTFFINMVNPTTTKTADIIN